MRNRREIPNSRQVAARACTRTGHSISANDWQSRGVSTRTLIRLRAYIRIQTGPCAHSALLSHYTNNIETSMSMQFRPVEFDNRTSDARRYEEKVRLAGARTRMCAVKRCFFFFLPSRHNFTANEGVITQFLDTSQISVHCYLFLVFLYCVTRIAVACVICFTCSKLDCIFLHQPLK